MRVVPDVAVSNGSGGGMADGLMALLLRSQLNGIPEKTSDPLEKR